MGSQRTGGSRETNRIWTDLERQGQADGEDTSLLVRGNVMDPDKGRAPKSLEGRWPILRRKISSG